MTSRDGALSWAMVGNGTGVKVGVGTGVPLGVVAVGVVVDVDGGVGVPDFPASFVHADRSRSSASRRTTAKRIYWPNAAALRWVPI
jgi:hypothetical protein